MFGMYSISQLSLGIGVVGVIIYSISQYNKGVGLRNYVNEAFSTMDVYLKKRWDMLPNLVETVKGYAGHESSVLKEVTELRSKSYSSMTDDEKINTNAQLGGLTNKLLMLQETYPDLKANENFNKLMDELTSLENDIARSRKYYNGTVRELNNFVDYFPTNIISAVFGIKKAKFFEISEEQRENVKVEF